jgi:hypothetical protein
LEGTSQVVPQDRHRAGAVPNGRLIVDGLSFDPSGPGAAISSGGRDIATAGGNVITSGGDVELNSATGDGDIVAGDASVAGIFKAVAAAGVDTANQKGFLYRDTMTENLLEVAKWISVHAAAWLPGSKAGVADPWEDHAVSQRWYVSAENGQCNWRFEADTTDTNTSAPLYVPLQLPDGAKLADVLLDMYVGAMDTGHTIDVRLAKHPVGTYDTDTQLASVSIHETSGAIHHYHLTPSGTEIVDNSSYSYFLQIYDNTLSTGTNATEDVVMMYGARVQLAIREASGAY